MTASAGGFSRRAFLTRGAATTGGAYLYLAAPALARLRHVRAADLRTGVAILGGGVGGLTVAHELAERGFRVTVFEPKALGGKARSMPVPGTGSGGRAELPGEHGFRFFPGFYKNVPDTMRRIPVPGNANGVYDNLVDAQQEMFIFENGQIWLLPSFDAEGFQEGMRSLVTGIGLAADVPANEIEYFVRKLAVFQTSSDARRLGEWENVLWWDYVNAERFSERYQKVFGNGLTKDLVAAKGKKASTRTIGLMALAFVYSILSWQAPPLAERSGYKAPDRLLDGPTNEAWIDPWVSHLQSLGVDFVT
ncbi:MAG: hypothetical protein QOD60_1590, partial [Solirubrobacterales bacterium]|nr:hypothetical protein [Solirubrobacterales bacterium]